MIAKLFKGAGFAGILPYVLNRKAAHLLEAVGVRNYDTAAMVRDFQWQRSLRMEVRKPMAHTVLSWSQQDRHKIDPPAMARFAREYLERLGVTNTQYLTVYHSDTAHPHVHVVYNRVDNEGRGIHINREWYNSGRICQEMSALHGFSRRTNRHYIHRGALRGRDRQRIAVYDALSMVLKVAQSWKELKSRLALQQVEVFFARKRKDGPPIGIVFGKDQIKFKGSAIGRDFTLQEIQRKLDVNRALQMREQIALESQARRQVKSAGDHPEHHSVCLYGQNQAHAHRQFPSPEEEQSRRPGAGRGMGR